MALKINRGNNLVIDLGSYSIKFLVGSYSQNQLKINDMFSVRTPENSFVDGKIIDSKSLSTAIKDAISQHSVKCKKTIVTFSSTEVIQRDMTVPKLNYEDTIGLIRYDISQYLPINVADYDVTYVVESSILEEGVEKYNVVSYIVKKSIIDQLYDLIKSCSLEPIALDLHSNAVSKFANFLHNYTNGNSALRSKPDKTLALVDVGYRTMLIDVIVGNKVELSRSINMGYYNQDKLIADKFGLSMDEAENFRRDKLSDELDQLKVLYDQIKYVDFENDSIDKARYNIGEGMMSFEEKQLFELLRDCMREYEDMGEELSKVLQYYYTRNKDNKIDSVLFHGASALNQSLIDHLSSILDYEAGTVKFADELAVRFPETSSNKLAFVNTIGALIRREEG